MNYSSSVHTLVKHKSISNHMAQAINYPPETSIPYGSLLQGLEMQCLNNSTTQITAAKLIYIISAAKL